MAGDDKVAQALGGVETAVARDISAILHAAGETIQVAAQISITENSVSGKFHVPSKPGEAPNQDSGTLANGIVVTQPEPLRVEITATAPYSAALELGTSKMAPRPFMAPALEEHRQEVKDSVAVGVQRALRRHLGKGV